MENKHYYDLLKSVPETAKKEIAAGRLKGMTDISPQWRYEVMTEVFGPIGIGWKYEITNRELIDGADGNRCAFVDINLYYKSEGEWSCPIPGTGGSSFIAKERSGFYTSDECFKMALTDALSVAMKTLGVGADVYRGYSDSKYSKKEVIQQKPEWWSEAVKYLKDGGSIDNITKKYQLSDTLKEDLMEDSL